MKRIALAIEKFSRFSGGAESYAVELAETLEREGWEVHLIGNYWDGSPTKAIFHKIRRLPKLIPPSLRILYFASAHRSIVKTLELDVVLGFGNTVEMNVYQSHGGVHFYSSLRKLEAATNPFIHMMKRLLVFVSPKSLARAWIEGAPFRRKPRPVIIAISDMVRNDICQRYGLGKSDVELVYNGVNLERFSQPRDISSRKNMRGGIGFSDEVLFLFMAYDFRKKGVSYLLQASGKLLAKVGKGKFGVVIVGSVPSPSLLRSVTALGLQSTVVFQGQTKEPETYYNSCDVFVLPTFYDACSLVVFEAMAGGLPAITTVYNGASGIIDNGCDGIVLNDPRNVQEMTAAMEKFLNFDFLKDSSQMAREKASKYTLQSNHARMLNILNHVADGFSPDQ
jgi:UDP-glucose:(heptosyl)LPS alpha-1,3-glucosyltransferase